MSVQRYLLIVILSVVTLASFAAALQGYKASRERLTQIFDEEMKSFALALMNSPIKLGGQQTTLPSTFAYQVFDNNSLLLKSNNAPDKAMTTNNQGFVDDNFLNKRWRVFVLVNSNIKVIVAQAIEQRVESVEHVLLEAILPIVYVIPIIGLVVFFAINRSLKPLSLLSKQLKQKNVNDLTPVKVNENSAELKPIEQTLNLLLERLDNAFEREKRLSADAAHELRTPISVLKITAHNLSVAYQANNISQQHIDELNDNTLRMAHVIEQIITLNRTTPENFSQNTALVDLRELLQKVISDNYEKVDKVGQSIALNAKATPFYGDAFSLEILFDNLIKNANKYSGDNSQIMISIYTTAQRIEVIVEDSGIGISPDKLDKVFQRFYRIKQHAETGSGLGLSIVKHIVDLHHGEIALTQSPLGGLSVSLIFPQNINRGAGHV
ncbi:ATP-binding protein [Thalassotalea castellviae]|uniref:histidine kinase n=1 Tax=Thalassotalea castellviae TaxID=3075612 RepID=A0ABU2ZWN1_9GAMM|nr:ATP-binding protein [Thalassotalea sp. W431]MDT0602331.1 ATP-binding protein [Thalassotalea sp. W431]